MSIDFLLSEATRDKILAYVDRIYNKVAEEWDGSICKWFRSSARYKRIEERVIMRHIGEIYITIAMNTEYDSIGYEEIIEFVRAVHKSNDVVLNIPIKEKEVYEFDLSGQCCDDEDEAGSVADDDAVLDESLREC